MFATVKPPMINFTSPARPFLSSTLGYIPLLSFLIKCINTFIYSSDRILELSAYWHGYLMIGLFYYRSCYIVLFLWYQIHTPSIVFGTDMIADFIGVLHFFSLQYADAISVDDSAVLWIKPHKKGGEESQAHCATKHLKQRTNWHSWRLDWSNHVNLCRSLYLALSVLPP